MDTHHSEHAGTNLSGGGEGGEGRREGRIQGRRGEGERKRGGVREEARSEGGGKRREVREGRNEGVGRGQE